MGNIHRDEMDLTYLEWTKTRHSSGTAGSFLKAYEKINGRKTYYKLSNYDVAGGIVGHECINEIVVDRLLDAMGIDHLEYDLINARIMIRGRLYHTYLCRSYDFKKPGESKIALDSYYDMYHNDDEEPLEFCHRMGWSQYLDSMFAIDYLIMNRDRHGANIEIIKNRYNHNYYPAPFFDHGLSLLCSCRSDEEFKLTDPLAEKRVQCFVGTDNTRNNLQLIANRQTIRIPKFTGDLRESIFCGLEGIVSEAWIDSVWNFLLMRAEQYEDIFN